MKYWQHFIKEVALILTLENKIIGGFIVALMLQLLVGAVSYRSTVRLTGDFKSVKHTQKVLNDLTEILSTMTDGETGQRGYIITGDERFLQPYVQALGTVDEKFASVQQLTLDNPRQQERLSRLRPLIDQRLSSERRAIESRKVDGFTVAQRYVCTGDGKALQDGIRGLIDEMKSEESGLLEQQEERSRGSVRFTLAIIVNSSLLSFLLLTMALVIIRRGFAEREQIYQSLNQTNSLHQAILDGAGYAIIAGDSQGITLFNRGAEKLLGYQSSEVVGKHTAAIFHDPEEVARRARELSTELGTQIEPGFEVFLAKSRRGIVDEQEWTYRRKDGRSVPVQLCVTALRDQAGKITNFLGIASDISERKKVEADLQEAYTKLAREKVRAETSDHLKSAFLATMSHELRTPLNSIIGFTGIVLQGLAGPLNPEQTKQLEMVRGSARHLLALINDVLDLSKIEAGELQVSSQPIDLHACVDRAMGAMQPLAAKKGLTLRTLLPPVLPQVVADPHRLEQILLNLLSNAIKFSERGEVVVTAQPTSTSIQISVADSGIGIKSEDLTTLFRPFRQLDTGLARHSEGTGLGLAISRRLARLMGGDIHVHSQWGIGSEFTICMPLPGGVSGEQENPVD